MRRLFVALLVFGTTFTLAARLGDQQETAAA
jgi:hypothetical protein